MWFQHANVLVTHSDQTQIIARLAAEVQAWKKPNSFTHESIHLAH